MSPSNKNITVKPEFRDSLLDQGLLESFNTNQLSDSFKPPSIGSDDNSSGTSTKKRKPKVRACDGCAIRKVKCEASRPCSHCISNNLKCTNLRVRKKSGPKNLQQRTLDSIQSINDGSKPRPLLSHNSSSNTIYLSDGGPESNTEILTPQVLIDILLLVSEEPIIFELLNPLTVQSILSNNMKLIEFLSTKYYNELENSLIITQVDPVTISKLALILSLDLLILENLTKLNVINYNDFVLSKNVKKFLKKEYLMNYKTQVKYIITDILSILDRVLLFPNLEMSIDQNQINYNLSLISLHLFNYNLILNTSSHKNTQNEQQKLILLRKAISYYQLVQLPNQNDLNIIQLYELFEYLYTTERLYLFTTSLTINSNYLLLNYWKSSTFNISNKFNKNLLFEVFKKLEEEELFNLENSQKIVKLNGFNNYKLKPFSISGETEIEVKFLRIKGLISKPSNKETTFEIVKLVILSKVLLLKQCEVSASFFRNEIIYTIDRLTDLLKDNDLLKVQISNYQLLPHFLLILKAAILCKMKNMSNLIKYSDQLILVLPIHNNKKIRSDIVLSEWFNNLKDMNRSLVSTSDQKFEDFDKLTVIKKESEAIFSELMDGFGNCNFISSNNSSIPMTPEAKNSSPELPLQDYIISKPNTNDLHLPVLLTNDFMSKDPAPPITQQPQVTSTFHHIKKEEDNANGISVSESTKSLYNLFNQINDSLAPSTSFSNLLQLNGLGPNQDVTINANTL